MPRPQPKIGGPVFYSYAHDLSDTAKTELINFLGIEPDATAATSAAIRKVENLLGAYKQLDNSFQSEPRASDYQLILPKLQKQVADLLNATSNPSFLNAWMRDSLDTHGAEIDKLEMALIVFCDAINATLRDVPKEENRGRPKRDALKTVVSHLRQVFAEHYQGGGSSQRRRQGAKEDLSEREAEEVDFITTALKDAKIRFPENIRSLFDAPATPEKRTKHDSAKLKRMQAELSRDTTEFLRQPDLVEAKRQQWKGDKVNKKPARKKRARKQRHRSRR